MLRVIWGPFEGQSYCWVWNRDHKQGSVCLINAFLKKLGQIVRVQNHPILPLFNQCNQSLSESWMLHMDLLGILDISIEHKLIIGISCCTNSPLASLPTKTAHVIMLSKEMRENGIKLHRCFSSFLFCNCLKILIILVKGPHHLLVKIVVVKCFGDCGVIYRMVNLIPWPWITVWLLSILHTILISII